jgi:hypothetical protein
MVARDFDPASVAAPLAWISADEFLAWNRSSHRVERQSLRTAQGANLTVNSATGVVLASEPANATFADDLLIASLRSNDGRLTVAYRRDGELPLWQHDDLKTFAVRCADDTHPPCFALRIGDKKDAIHRIDPVTGKLGDLVYEDHRLEDIAVDRNGTRLVVATLRDRILIDFDTSRPATTTLHKLPVQGGRSVAFGRRGGIFVTGTMSRNTYQAGYVAPDDTYSSLLQTENELLSLIRPDPGDQRVVLLSRSYAPVLWDLSP